MDEKYNYRKNIDFVRYKTGLRSNLCGQLRKDSVGECVRVCGWINRRRDHGKLIFIDLRDFSGIVQIVIDANINEKV